MRLQFEMFPKFSIYYKLNFILTDVEIDICKLPQCDLLY